MTISTPVIVLAGGLGTRLRESVPDVPKILAPIKDTPFIDILLSWLVKQGAQRVIFSLGYKAEQVQHFIDGRRKHYPLLIDIVTEEKALGTLGAISLVLSECQLKQALVINGDTWVDVSLRDFVSQGQQAPVAMVRHYSQDISRYGAVKIDDQGYVTAFIEKHGKEGTPGWINAGIYLLNKPAIDDISIFNCGSFEHDYLSSPRVNIKSIASTGKGFIDIGTATSYRQAPEILKEFLL